jgi:hypothetical protein
MFLLPFSSFHLTIFVFSPHLESPLCFPEREHEHKRGLSERRIGKPMYIFQPLFLQLAACILLLSNGLPPEKHFIPKKPTKPFSNDLFRISICIFLLWLFQSTVFISLLCYPSIFLFFIIAALLPLLLRLAIPRIPAHVSQVPIPVFFSFF